MNAKFRKKQLYRQIFHTIAQDVLKADATVARDMRAWRSIERNLLRVFGNEYSAAWNWFISPAPALNGMRPANLVQNGNVRSVLEHLVRLEYCVYT
jgi:uncharacterized protein (DUF2384 family)